MKLRITEPEEFRKVAIKKELLKDITAYEGKLLDQMYFALIKFQKAKSKYKSINAAIEYWTPNTRFFVGTHMQAGAQQAEVLSAMQELTTLMNVQDWHHVPELFEEEV